MNKTIIIAGGIIILLIGVVSISYFGDEKDDDKFASKGSDDIPDGTLGDFIKGKMGVNLMCEFSQPIADKSTLNITTYVANDKVRVDYIMTPPLQGQSDLHMITDGEYGYIWGDSTLGDAFSGMKIKLDDDLDSEEATQQNEVVDYSIPVVNCEKWSVDNSKFDLPDDVDFMGMEEMTPGGDGTNMPAGTANGCDICEQMPEGQKGNCLRSMGCEDEE